MLLSTAYLPPIEYFQKIVFAETVQIEAHENFVKQTYRNRCRIYGANGVQELIIPLVNTHEKILISEKQIAWKQNWQQQHWKSIESAYRNSPYFIYYADELMPFYKKRFELLLEYNMALLWTLLRLLKVDTEISLTNSFEKNAKEDFRYNISPKAESGDLFPSYTQVFNEKHGFKSNLSIIDLLFNKGPDAIEYLRNR